MALPVEHILDYLVVVCAASGIALNLAPHAENYLGPSVILAGIAVTAWVIPALIREIEEEG